MPRYGLIGYPLTHSFSKQFFTDKFEKEKRHDCFYENFPMENIASLPALLSEKIDLAGLNVTIPHKRKVIPFLNEITTIVEKTGACNCIRIEQGKLLGYNTDVIGFQESILPKLQKHHHQALILGTGGASAAVEYVFRELSIPFLFVSRDPHANHLGYEQLDEKIMRNHTIIVNTTPLGTYPNIFSFPPLPYQYITEQHFLYDLVYNPKTTVFLQKGIDKGATVLNGLDMLVGQANASWDIWNR
jgi:shikimate dehydrogenase